MSQQTQTMTGKDFEQRLKETDYFSISFVARDVDTGKFYKAKWTTQGYKTDGMMSDNFRGTHYEV